MAMSIAVCKTYKYENSHLNLSVLNVVEQRRCIFVGQRPGGKLFPPTFVHGKEPTVGQPLTVMGDRLEQDHLSFGQQTGPSSAPVVRGRVICEQTQSHFVNIMCIQIINETIKKKNYLFNTIRYYSGVATTRKSEWENKKKKKPLRDN